MAATPVIKLSSATLLETAKAGTVIGTLTVEGGSPSAEWSFSWGTNDHFEIKFDTTTQSYQLVSKVEGSTFFDFENDALKEFTVTISAEDMKGGTLVENVPFIVSVTDNKAPTDMTLSNASVFEHAQAGTEVGSLSAIDPDLNDTFTYTLLNDAEGRFEIVNGKLLVKDGTKLDYLTASSHQVTIEVKDADNNVFQKTLTINVADALELKNGTSKNNKLYGTEGADAINGLAGNDWIFGNGGDDVINGGSGKDMLYGGAGKDTFVFDTKVKKGHFDHIKDFNVADDTIQINMSALGSFKVKMSKKDAYGDMKGGKGSEKKFSFKVDKVLKKGKLDTKFFSLADKAKDSSDLFYYNSKNGFVYFDADGSGKGKGIEIAKLSKGLNLTADDFLFI